MTMRQTQFGALGVLFAAAIAGLVTLESACTPSTVDTPLGVAGESSAPTGSGGSSSTGVDPRSTGGSATGNSNAVGGTSNAAGGSTPSDSGGSLSASGGTTGSTATAGGAPAAAGGAPAAGGAAQSAAGGTPATTAAGGAAGAGTGCNWVQGATGLWTMNPATADKIVLFDGKDLSQWHQLNQVNTPAQWKVLPDGTMQVVPLVPPTNIQSNRKFDDACVHVEYMTPTYDSNDSNVQNRGNSGVYLKSAYEMQILDTSLLPPLNDGCGAVYMISPPMVVACHQFLQWNTYEIEFKTSGWDTSTPPKKIKDATYVQVALNGKLVQKNVDLPPLLTQAGIPDAAGPQPLALQDHKQTVSFRNVWVTIPKY